MAEIKPSSKGGQDSVTTSKKAGPLINAITFYRIVTFPVLVVLIFIEELTVFRWMIATSFLTDAIDGFLARKFRVASTFGARIDSIGDDLTVLAGLIGLVVFKPSFLLAHLWWVGLLLTLFIIQLIAALIQYGKMTSFHTYLAKLAAVLQGVFLIGIFFFGDQLTWLFYVACITTMLQLIEEIIIIYYLRSWQSDVKGLYWIIRK